MEGLWSYSLRVCWPIPCEACPYWSYKAYFGNTSLLPAWCICCSALAKWLQQWLPWFPSSYYRLWCTCSFLHYLSIEVCNSALTTSTPTNDWAVSKDECNLEAKNGSKWSMHLKVSGTITVIGPTEWQLWWILTHQAASPVSPFSHPCHTYPVTFLLPQPSRHLTLEVPPFVYMQSSGMKGWLVLLATLRKAFTCTWLLWRGHRVWNQDLF